MTFQVNNKYISCIMWHKNYSFTSIKELYKIAEVDHSEDDETCCHYSMKAGARAEATGIYLQQEQERA